MLSISVIYKNSFGVKCTVSDLSSVMEAYRTMNNMISANRCMIEFKNGTIASIHAKIVVCNGVKTKTYVPHKKDWFVTNPDYKEYETRRCRLAEYKLHIKIGEDKYERKSTDKRALAEAYVKAAYAGYPVYISDNAGNILCCDNVERFSHLSVINK